MEKEGALQREGERLVWTGAPTAETLPLGVQDIILQRVGRLSEPAQRLLTLAAVVGQPFDAALLQAAAASRADAVEVCLEEWLARRLIHHAPLSLRRPAAMPRYDFSHDKIRAVLYHTTDAEQRRGLHRRVGEALEHVFSDQIDEHVGLLAYHWEQAQDLERATAYLLRAGDQARRVYAHQEATDYYERALALLEMQGDAGREQTARTLMKLGLTHHEAFDFRQAQQVYREGLERWQQAGKHPASAPLPPAPHALRVRWLEPTTLDPTMSPDSHTSSLMTHLFSGLVALSPELTIVPDVAQAWDVSADGRRYVFHLRDDVRWSDGAPVTAGDFAYTWKRALDPATGSPSAGFLHHIAGARAFHQGRGSREDVGVRATDETTLLVELEEPTSYFLQLLVRPNHYPVPRHVVEAHGAAWTEPDHVVTNGPFRLEAWQRGEKLILSRNPDYHGRFQGNVQRVELSPLTDWSARLQRYEADELDVLGIGFFPAEQRQLARQRHADDYVSRPVLENCYLVFDVTRPPFDDVRMRRAFTLATNRRALAEEALQGYATPAAGGLLPQGMPGHSPDVGLPHDPERARHLLAEAGYPKGRGFPAVDALAFGAVEARTDYLEAQWRRTLGVEIAWQTPEWGGFSGAAEERAAPPLLRDVGGRLSRPRQLPAGQSRRDLGRVARPALRSAGGGGRTGDESGGADGTLPAGGPHPGGAGADPTPDLRTGASADQAVGQSLPHGGEQGRVLEGRRDRAASLRWFEEAEKSTRSDGKRNPPCGFTAGFIICQVNNHFSARHSGKPHPKRSCFRVKVEHQRRLHSILVASQG